jgi:hypothetical protein
MGENTNANSILMGKVEDITVDVRIILMCILKKWMRWHRLDSSVVSIVMYLQVP